LALPGQSSNARGGPTFTDIRPTKQMVPPHFLSHCFCMFWTVETARRVLQTKSIQHCCPMQALAQRLTKPIREFNQSF
jgi:hypothetical protein